MQDKIKIFLYLWLIGSFVAFVLHFFLYELTSDFSLWNVSLGWQREIALWNFGIIFAIVFSLIKNNPKMLRFMVIILTFISLLLGTNHFAGLIISKKITVINLLGVILNYIIVIFGLFIIKVKNEKN